MSRPWRIGLAGFSLDRRSIGLFRLAVGVITLWDLLRRYADARALYSNAGVYPLSGPAVDLGAGFFSFQLLSQELWFQDLSFAVAIGAAIALILGYHARLANLVVWLSVLSLQHRNPLALEGFDVYHRLLLFWANFLPLGDRLSIDAWRRGVRGSDEVASFGTLAFTVQVGCIYLFNGIHKLNADWLSGAAVERSFRYLYLPTPLAQSLLEFPALLRICSWGTLVAELGLPLLLVIPFHRAQLRLVFVGALALLHASIWACLDVGLYSAVSISALLALLPGRFWQAVEGLIGRNLGGKDEAEVPRRRGLAGAMGFVAALGMSYVVFHNLGDAFFPSWLSRRPAGIAASVDLIGLRQRWTMFFRTADTDVWPVFVGRLASGEAVRFPVATPIADGWRLQSILPEFRSHRWEKYFLAVGKPQPRLRDLRESFARYWCERWAQDRADLDLSGVEFWFVEYTGSSGASKVLSTESFPCSIRSGSSGG